MVPRDLFTLFFSLLLILCITVPTRAQIDDEGPAIADLSEISTAEPEAPESASPEQVPLTVYIRKYENGTTRGGSGGRGSSRETEAEALVWTDPIKNLSLWNINYAIVEDGALTFGAGAVLPSGLMDNPDVPTGGYGLSMFATYYFSGTPFYGFFGELSGFYSRLKSDNANLEGVIGGIALAINEKGFNGFVTIPYGTLSRNTITENYTLEIDGEGVITITEEKELDGTAAYAIRRALEDITEEDLEELMEGLVSYEEGEVELASYEVKNQDDYKAPLSIVLKYEIDNLVTITPEEVIVQTGGLLSPVSSTGTKIETDKRVNPIRIYSDERLVKKITLRYPSEWRFNTDLKTVDYSNDFGELKVSYTDRGEETEINMSRTLRKSNESAERFSELMDIVGSRSRYLNVPALIFAVE